MARPGRCSRSWRPPSRGSAPGPPHAIVPRSAGRRAGRIGSTRGLRDGLAEALGDAELELAYPVGEDRFADGAGGRSTSVCWTVAPRRRWCEKAGPSRLFSTGPTSSTTRAHRRSCVGAPRARERAPAGRGAGSARGSPLLARVSSRRATPSAAGSSAISTTAPSNASSGCRSGCASCPRARSRRGRPSRGASRRGRGRARAGNRRAASARSWHPPGRSQRRGSGRRGRGPCGRGSGSHRRPAAGAVLPAVETAAYLVVAEPAKTGASA